MNSLWRDGERVRGVALEGGAGGRYRVRVDDAEFEVAVERLADGRLRLTTDTGVLVAEVTAVGARRFVSLGALDFVLDRESATRTRRAAGHAGGLEAPMPGVVTRVLAAAGDAVVRGQPLVALEAMKMEHLIRAPRDGRVKRVAATAGEMVAGGATLVELED